MIIRSFLFLLFIFSTLPSDLHAADALRFNRPVPLRAQGAIEVYAKESLQPSLTGLSIAATDLNNDGINEFIIRDQACPAPAEPCRYVVLGDTEQGIVLLGDFQAREIMLGNSFSHGVRDLLVKDSEGNDFIFGQYVWDAQTSRYTMVNKGDASIHAR